MTDLLLEWTIKIVVVFSIILTAVAYLSYMERKVMGWMQLRQGPNRVGPFGLLQPLADGIKFMFKEDIVPQQSSKLLFAIAPMLLLIPAIMSIVVIPYGSEVTLFGRVVALHITRLDV
ncbi:MAG TPA: NADH-quinone oxidoreductase subunit H, partial [Blastocatellia bacterium]|nr:NADH-quinone oxidoreductase subunit H [Blastocatellia bacterium]